MEIDVTRFVTGAEPFEFSASIAERGQDAGKETWQNAVTEGTSSPLLTTPDQLKALRDHVKGFGAWDDEEIAAWSDTECNALFIQLISGDMREMGLEGDPDDFDWDAYEAETRPRQHLPARSLAGHGGPRGSRYRRWRFPTPRLVRQRPRHALNAPRARLRGAAHIRRWRSRYRPPGLTSLPQKGF